MGIINLAPLPYHQAIRAFLKREESRVWEWFASHTARDEQADAVRFDLLKKTYRIERTADPQLYAIADEVMTIVAFALEHNVRPETVFWCARWRIQCVGRALNHRLD